jgi:acetyl esterase/lipase
MSPTFLRSQRAGWPRRLSTAKARPAELNERYGSGERQRYDFFYGDATHAPLVVYVHGGY